MNNFGTVKFEGKIYTLDQEAYLDPRCPDGLSGDEFVASAHDDAGNEYNVYWTISHDDPENEEDMSNLCNWDKPSNVFAV